MTDFKYNVGDKVVSLENYSFWNNSMHYKKFEASFVSTVTSADSKHFSNHFQDPSSLNSWNSFDKYHIFSQENGACRNYSPHENSLFHLVADNSRLRKFFESKINEAFEENKKEEEKVIADLEAQIKNLQARIEKVKSVGLDTTFGKMKQREFLAERRDFIMNALDIQK